MASTLDPNNLDTTSSRIPTFAVATLERGQFEVDDNNKRFTIIGAPCQHSLKKCIHSYQSLPARTRQTMRIAAISITSALILLAIFYLARLAANEESSYSSDVLVQEDLLQKMRIPEEVAEIDGGSPYHYEINEEAEGEQQSVPGGRRIPLLKTFKDTQGKVRYYGTDHMGKPLDPKDIIEFSKMRRKLPRISKPASEKDIEDTLSLVRQIVDQDRKLIHQKELKYWEPGTEPLTILLVSTWRSGSTFLGQILESHPGVYQHFEPLSHLGVHQVRSGKEAFESQQLIHRLLDCKYKGLDKYMNYTRHYPNEMMGHNLRAYNACKKGPNRNTCFNETFLSEACKLFPIQLVKTVRLRLNLTQLLLNDEKLRVKVIFLVRDPRATMNSRYNSVTWCSSSPDCSSPDLLCQDIEGDLKVAAAFQKLYPDRFLKVKYEDIALEPEKEVMNILDFLGLEYTDDTQIFINENTKKNKENAWSITRKSPERVSLWKKQLPLEEIHAVQNACGNVLKLLKYEVVEQ